jgi:hypothetical protein
MLRSRRTRGHLGDSPGFMVSQEMKKKEKTWRLLRILKQRSMLPWLCCGDFNEVMFNCEKEGGRCVQKVAWKI